MSDRSRITAELVKLCATILASNGSRTDIGRSVFTEPMILEEIEAPCCMVIAGDESPAANAGYRSRQIDFEVRGYASRSATYIESHAQDPRAEYAVIDAVIEDILDAVEACKADSSLFSSFGYQGASPIRHESGGDICGAIVRYSIATPWIEQLAGTT